jgi:hypothetical protein
MFSNLDKIKIFNIILTEVKKLNDSDILFEKELLKLYSSDNQLMRFAATLFNYSYSSKQTMFLLSYRIFESMLINDPNIERKSISGNEYGKFIKYLAMSKSIELILEHQSKGRRLAALYKIIQKDVRKHVNTTDIDDLIIKWVAEMARDDTIIDQVKTEALEILKKTKEKEKIIEFMEIYQLLNEDRIERLKQIHLKGE